MKQWTHDGLLNDLRAHVEKTGVNGSRMVWQDIPIGSHGSQRPDLFSLEKSFVKPCPTVYEIKVSRSDFLSDVTSGKWTGYTKFASMVIFCVPQKLVKKTEVPEKAGLMVRGPKGWRTLKRGFVSGQLPEFHRMLKLLLHTDAQARERQRQADISFFKINKEIKKKHGEKVAQIIANVAMADTRIQEAEREAKRIISEAQHIKEIADDRAKEKAQRYMADYDSAILEAKESLGLPDDTSHFMVLHAIKQVSNALEGYTAEKSQILGHLLGEISRMKNHIEQAITRFDQFEKRAIKSTGY